MVGLMPQDGESPVKLFNEDQTHQFMRESHLAQGNLLVGTVIYLGRESVGATNDKNDAFAATGHASLQPPAEVHRGALGAVFVKQHHMVTALERGKQLFALSYLLLCFAHVAGAFHISDILDIELHIVLQAFHIFLYALPNETNLCFANNGECYLHFSLRVDFYCHKISKSAEISVIL